ncbi:MAG TPA: NADH dehydrogenase subunit F, partial [Candidatus Dormibacteraeota bacterium]|nr:NADH dehydrogenase subunit F [Candidatus Dormibacteraeota bacterium]
MTKWGPSLIEVLVRTGLTGRGGASFPVGLKWRAVAAGSQGTAVVIVNGAEGEPHSKKDRHLMTSRPHLILDGALVAAASVRAKQIVLYIGEEHHAS